MSGWRVLGGMVAVATVSSSVLRLEGVRLCVIIVRSASQTSTYLHFSILVLKNMARDIDKVII
jgi:hypothetical protein